jgi:hypothetical protein
MVGCGKVDGVLPYLPAEETYEASPVNIFSLKFGIYGRYRMHFSALGRDRY